MIVDWTTVISETISGLITGIVIAALGYVFLDRYTQRIAFAEKMSAYGFSNVSLEKQSSKEVAEMCAKADEIKIINVSGLHFLSENRLHLRKALDRGCAIHFLCARPDSQFLTDIENMEMNTYDSSGARLREPGSLIGNEVRRLTSEFEVLGMDIRYYSSEYRLPYVLAHYPDGTERAWLTMTLPPYKSTRSFVLRGHLSPNDVQSSDVNFMEMMETNFNTIWEHGSISAEEYRDELLFRGEGTAHGDSARTEGE